MFPFFKSQKTPFSVGTIFQKNFLKKLSFEFTAGLIFLKVTIQNKNYRFMLDTGAFSIVSPEIREKLFLQSEDEILQTLDAFGNYKESNVYKLPSLRIAGVEFNDFAVLVDDFMHTFPLSCLKFDGIIGYNFLQKVIITLDYQTNIIILSDSIVSKKGFTKIALKQTTSNAPSFSLQFKNRKLEVGLDTGKNDGLMINDTKLLEYFREQNYKHERTTGVFSSSINGVNQHSFIDSYEVKNFTIAKKVVIDSFVCNYEEYAQNIVGNSFLKHFKIMIDIQKNALYLQQQSDIKGILPKEFGFITFWSEKDKLFISAIIQGSPAYDSKLKIGDRILAIDELDTHNFTQEDYCEYIFLKKKALVKTKIITILTIKRSSKLFQVSLSLKT